MVHRLLARLSLLIGILVMADSRADYLGFFPNGDEAKEIDFGNGEDGSFSDGSTASGVGGAAPNITINTNVKSVFRFSSFVLNAGNTIVVSGSQPLVIYVAGDATIAGTIRSNGSVGGAVPSRLGGNGGAGGGAGGDGGIQKDAGASRSGSAGNGASSGGGGGVNVFVQGSQNGGGGGCFGVSGAGANDAAVAGDDGGDGGTGTAGSCSIARSGAAANFESDFRGGAGGGGGSANTSPAADYDGAGGGGGGGAIRIAVQGNLSHTGAIEANGAAGGAGGAPVFGHDCGASGGGGSGGAIWIQVGNTFSGNGPLSVTSGAGGTDGTCGINGGAGSRGIVRLDSLSSTFAGAINPAGADLSYSISRLPVVTNFTMNGGGLVCSRILDPEKRPAPWPGLLEILAWGAFAAAVIGHAKSRLRRSDYRSPTSH